MGEKKMSWETVEGGDFLDMLSAIGFIVDVSEQAHSDTERVVATGLVGADEKQTEFTFNALEGPVLSLALNLVGFFSPTLGPVAKDLALRIIEKSSIVPGADPDLDDRLAQARQRIYHEDMMEMLTSIGLSDEEAEAEARAATEAGLLEERAREVEGSNPVT